MRVSVCLGAILIPEYLYFHSGYSAPMNIFLFRNIPNERVLSLFSSRCLDRNGCQTDYKKLKISSKQKTIFQISDVAEIISCGL